MPSVSYTIYRKTSAIEASSDRANDHAIGVLVHMGVQNANGPKQALTVWFDQLPFDKQVEMNGNATFIVVPTSNHHELHPKVQSAPRLVFP